MSRAKKRNFTKPKMPQSSYTVAERARALGISVSTYKRKMKEVDVARKNGEVVSGVAIQLSRFGRGGRLNAWGQTPLGLD